MESAARWLALPLAAATFTAGVWVAGGLLTNSFRASMALVAVWYAAAGAAALATGLRRRRLRAPVWTGYAVAALGVGGFLAWTTLRDRVVHERLTAGATISRGTFVSGEHTTHGVVAVVGRRDGRRFVTLRGFATSPGPDLRVRVQPGDVDLGALKGNIGDQQYALPPGRLPAEVVIWCRAFSATFGSAPLRPA
jgi:Electron transfer DM13